MNYSDTTSALVINKLTKSQYETLKASGSLQSNQIYITPETLPSNLGDFNNDVGYVTASAVAASYATKGEVEVVTASVSSLQSSVETLGSSVDAVSSQVSAIASSVSALGSDISSVGASVSTLSSQVGANTSSIAGLASSVSAMASNFNVSGIGCSTIVMSGTYADSTSFAFNVVVQPSA